MRVLAFNSGSSSIKCALIETATLEAEFDVAITDIDGANAEWVDISRSSLGPLSHREAIDTLFAKLRERQPSCDAIAHRIVHGGTFREPIRVDDEVLARIEALSALAPLHNPPALAVLRAAQAAFPAIPHIAVFDTAFHRTLPPRAREYALPPDVTRRFGIERLGFHGINHAYVMHAVSIHLRTTPEHLRIVSCHLGNGASVAAIEYGRSVETSMGFTPLEGLAMGTRAGDLDPGIALHLLESGMELAALHRMLNSESGLKGLTGTNDFAAIEQRAAAGDEACRRALAVYAHRIRKYIGAYAAVMGGVDVIAFTGGIGEHSALVRHRACQGLDFLGAVLDEDRNRDARVDAHHAILAIAADESRVRIVVIRADEQVQMAREAASLLAEPAHESSLTIPVAISARHAHLSQATIDQLFGAGYQLRRRAELSQLGQFSAEETIALIGPRGRIDHVRLMGPPRAVDQIEISRSDEFVLGIDAPVRLSGDLGNTPGVTLEGPRGRVTIAHGVICARRHIHANPSDAARLGIRHGEAVQVRIDSENRDLVFDNVIVRVAPEFQLELHLDTDEANAAGVRVGQGAQLLRR